MTQTFKPTNYRVKKGVQRLSGTNLNESMGYEKDSDLKSAVREAKLKKIDLKKMAERGWYVEFKDGVSAKVKTSSDLGLEYLPDGEEKNGYLYPNEEITVKVIYDSSGKVSHIVSTQITDKDTSTAIGATRISRGISEVSVGQEESAMSTEDSEIKTTSDSIELNSAYIYINKVKFDGVSNSITVAADDSPEEFIRRATFSCLGKNDTETVQSAIDHIGEGGLISFAPGTYEVSGIELKENCILEGSGSNTVLLLEANSTKNLMDSSVSKVTIRNIKFDGNNLNQTEYHDIINIGESTQNHIRNCEFTDVMGSAIIFDGAAVDGMCHDNSVVNCNINNCSKDAIKVNRAYDIVLQMCNIENSGISNLNTSGSIFINLSNNISIDLCKVKESNSNGVYVTASKGTKISGLNIEASNLNGILINQNTNTIIQNSIISNNGQLNITGNTNGILLQDGTDNSITGCNITDYETTKTQDYGIYMKYMTLTGQPDYILVKNNLLRGNKVSAIQSVGAHNIVSDNIGV